MAEDNGPAPVNKTTNPRLGRKVTQCPPPPTEVNTARWSGFRLVDAIQPSIGASATRDFAKAAIGSNAFWREAEGRFRRLQPPPPRPGEPSHDSHNGLRANWSRDGWSDSGKPWYLNNADEAIKKLFIWAAESASVELGHPGGEEALFFWLDLLRRDSPFFKVFGVGGYIYRVCDASAEYCVKCETDLKVARREGENASRGGISAVARPAVQAKTPSRFEIEKFVNEKFQAGIEDRIDGYAQKEAQSLAQVRSKGNIGGYLPALIHCKQEKLRTEILILADAWVEAGTVYAVSLPIGAEEALERAATLMTGGTNSAFQGEYVLMCGRTRRTPSGKGVAAGLRAITQSMRSALREGRLRIKKQRIETERLTRGVPASTPRLHPQQTSTATGKAAPSLTAYISSPKTTPTPKKRLHSTIVSQDAARRMENFLESAGVGQTEFAVLVNTTDRTLRNFRATGKVRRDIFDAIAKAMGTTREQLLRPEQFPQ
jgi:hypothetical protein